jgi:hypothetical protein
MKRLTIDASVALKFLLDEPGSDEARQFYSEEKDGRFAVSNVLLSPTLVLLEVHNTLAKRLWIGRANSQWLPMVGQAATHQRLRSR